MLTLFSNSLAVVVVCGAVGFLVSFLVVLWVQDLRAAKRIRDVRAEMQRDHAQSERRTRLYVGQSGYTRDLYARKDNA